MDTVYCVTEVYDSSKAQGFDGQDAYPVAWEVIFHNDSAGKRLIDNIYQEIGKLPKEKGYITGLDGTESDKARCLECVFDGADSFRRLLHGALDGIVLFDDQKKQVIPKVQLVDRAKEIGQVTELAI